MSPRWQGVRTASVKPFTCFSRITCARGTPLPVCDSATELERWRPTLAARRADLASFAFLAPIPKKFSASTAIALIRFGDAAASIELTDLFPVDASGLSAFVCGCELNSIGVVEVAILRCGLATSLPSTLSHFAFAESNLFIWRTEMGEHDVSAMRCLLISYACIISTHS